MQDILSLALNFLQVEFGKKGETVTERFFGFLGTGKVGVPSVLVRTDFERG